MKSFMTLKGLEKLTYLVLVPSVLAYGAFAIYKKNFLESEVRGQHIKMVEEKYIPENRANLIKLQNFKRKVFAVGLVDDILRDTSDLTADEMVQYQLAISKNAAMIRDFIKELAPEEIVLEICDERFQQEITDILSHPNYEKTMKKVHLLLD